MGDPAERRHRATYGDLEVVPPNEVAELIGGILHVMPRRAPRHAHAASALGAKLGNPFGFGEGGPGGWWILDEPELHFPDPAPETPGDVEAVVPDLAGWRRARMPELPDTAYFTLAPDWICEVLSVAHAWLVDPIARTVEVYALGRGGHWGRPETYGDRARVRLPPFEAVELDLAVLWA